MAGSKRERPKGSGRWELRAYIGNDPLSGKPRYKSTIYRNPDPTMGARDRAREADAALSRWTLDLAERPSSDSNATFGELLETWYRLVSGEFEKRTRKNVRGRIDNHIKPALGTKAVGKITTADLDLFYANLRLPKPEGKELAKDTVKKIHGVCLSAMELAVSYDWIKRNPATRTKPIKATKTRVDLPPLEDVKALMARAYEWDPVFGFFLYAKISIGCRRAELCGLRLHDVDFENGSIILRRAVVDEGEGVIKVKDLKGHKIRRFALDVGTLTVLKKQAQLMSQRAHDGATELRSDAYFWSHELDGSIPWRPPYTTLAFTRLRAPEAVDPKNPDDPKRWRGLKIRLHDLRHLNGSHLIDAGVPIPSVAFRLGHARNSTTSDFYAHPINESDKLAADAIGARLALGVGP